MICSVFPGGPNPVFDGAQDRSTLRALCLALPTAVFLTIISKESCRESPNTNKKETDGGKMKIIV